MVELMGVIQRVLSSMMGNVAFWGEWGKLVAERSRLKSGVNIIF